MPRVTNLVHFPVKGMRGSAQNTLTISAATGVKHDRNVAVTRKPHNPNEWAPKPAFHVGMNNARMPTLVPGSVRNHGQLAEMVRDELHLPELPELHHTYGNYNLTDTRDPSVSLINIATVRAFQHFLREQGKLSTAEVLNPQRFRMNIEVDDWAPFAELDLVDERSGPIEETFYGRRQITIGNLLFRVDDACERCKAVNANTLSGEYDLNLVAASGKPDLLDEFMQTYRPRYTSPQRGVTAVMGILLVPLQSGTLHLNDELVIH